MVNFLSSSRGDKTGYTTNIKTRKENKKKNGSSTGKRVYGNKQYKASIFICISKQCKDTTQKIFYLALYLWEFYPRFCDGLLLVNGAMQRFFQRRSRPQICRCLRVLRVVHGANIRHINPVKYLAALPTSVTHRFHRGCHGADAMPSVRLQFGLGGWIRDHPRRETRHASHVRGMHGVDNVQRRTMSGCGGLSLGFGSCVCSAVAGLVVSANRMVPRVFVFGVIVWRGNHDGGRLRVGIDVAPTFDWRGQQGGSRLRCCRLGGRLCRGKWTDERSV
jgi:hypothetical protein